MNRMNQTKPTLLSTAAKQRNNIWMLANVLHDGQLLEQILFLLLASAFLDSLDCHQHSRPPGGALARAQVPRLGLPHLQVSTLH